MSHVGLTSTSRGRVTRRMKVFSLDSSYLGAVYGFHLSDISNAANEAITDRVSPCAYTRACTSFCLPVKYGLRPIIMKKLAMLATKVAPEILYFRSFIQQSSCCSLLGH